MREGGEDHIGSIAALLQRRHADAVGLVEANYLAKIETLGRELSMDVMYGEANSPACVAWLTRLPIRSSTNHRLHELAQTLLEVELVWSDGRCGCARRTLPIGSRRSPGLVARA